MELNQKIAQLEAEIKLVKNEVKETLLDIRESILSHQNPFTSTEASPAAGPRKQEPAAAIRGVQVAQQEGPAARAPEPKEAGVAAQEGRGELGDGSPPERTPENESMGPGETAPAKAYTPMSAGPPLPTLPSPPRRNGQGNGALDLATIASLGRWVGNSITRIGRKRLEAIVEIDRMAGRLPPGLEDVLLRLTQLVDGDGPEAGVTMKDCIAALVQLDSLLGPDRKSETALLFLLLDDRDTSQHG